MIIHTYYDRRSLMRTTATSTSASKTAEESAPISSSRWAEEPSRYSATRKNRMMNNEKMNQILDELSKPFHPSRITWRPGALTGKKDKALALAYADLRAYQNRLDEICGMDWSVSYTPWGDRIICHLTINGITRSSTGEPDSDSERSEIAGTTAEAQAFKRACAMFGLGRYLYNLPSLWVEYDAPNQRFTEKAKARLHGLIAQHYQRFLDGQTESPLDGNGEETPEEVQVSAPTPAVVTEAAPAEQAPPPAAETPKKQATKKQPATVVQRPAEANGEGNEDALLPLRQKLDELGKELYGEQWSHVRAHNIKRLVGEQSDGNGALSQEQIQTLINGLKKLKQQRQAA